MVTSQVSFHAAMAGSVDDAGGARAVEVAAMLGDSVVNVKHCMDPRGGKITPATWGFLAGGLACLLASATAFYVSVDTAASNQRALERHTHVQHKPMAAFRPRMIDPAVDWVAFGGLALGLIGLTGALARARGERRSPYYRIGTAPGVDQPVEQAPAASFPLVAPSGDDFVLNYGAGMTGELIVDGKTTPLAALAAAGVARPSATAAGAFEIQIPPRARIRATAGQATFVVSAVAQPRRHAAPLLASLESRTMKYVAGSLVAHLGIWLVLQQIPVDDGGVAIDLGSYEPTRTDSSSTMKEAAPVEHEDGPSAASGGAASAAPSMNLPESGASARMRGTDHHRPEARMSYEEQIARARLASFLGSETLVATIASLTGETSLRGAFTDASIHDPFGDPDGAFFGGRRGFGGGGGCIVEPCGIIVAGDGYNNLFGGPGAGDDYWIRGNRDGHLIGRTPAVPTVRVSDARDVTGGLDRAIIKRYIRRAIDRIGYCYEHELLANPDLEGTVTVQFLVSPTGAVTTANGNGFDPAVTSCVTSVVKNIQFPRPSDNGNVQVTYPFTFRAPGQG